MIFQSGLTKEHQRHPGRRTANHAKKRHNPTAKRDHDASDSQSEIFGSKCITSDTPRIGWDKAEAKNISLKMGVVRCWPSNGYPTMFIGRNSHGYDKQPKALLIRRFQVMVKEFVDPSKQITGDVECIGGVWQRR